MNEITRKIEAWSKERGLAVSDPTKQLLKLGEEFGEVCEAYNKGKYDDLNVEIGDMFVVLTILAQQLGTSIDTCAALAYLKIEERKGIMRNGVYIKEDDL